MAPKQKPGRSEQIVQTPSDFLTAVKQKLFIKDFAIDLAASEANTVTPRFYSEEDNALNQSWAVDGWGWCNPPYADIEPWVAKALHEAGNGARTAMLVPASVGSNWWRLFVHTWAFVFFPGPRVTFVGHSTPYPKDLALLLYTPTAMAGYDTWRWK